MGLADQLDRLAPVGGASQPSASSEQKASHFFRSTSKAAISAVAFSLRFSSFLSALISRWSWARSFLSSLLLFQGQEWLFVGILVGLPPPFILLRVKAPLPAVGAELGGVLLRRPTATAQPFPTPP